LDELWDNADAWDALTSRKGPQALKDALFILELSNISSALDPNPGLKKILKGLEKLVNTGALSSADPDLLEQFHRLAEQVPGAPADPATRVEKMIEWLDAMTSRQIAELTPESTENLQMALERILTMSESVSRKSRRPAK
jgi:hypothetical protein